MELESANEGGVERRGREDREDVFEENSLGREVGVLAERAAEGGGQDGELFLGVFVGHF